MTVDSNRAITLVLFFLRFEIGLVGFGFTTLKRPFRSSLLPLFQNDLPANLSYENEFHLYGIVPYVEHILIGMVS